MTETVHVGEGGRKSKAPRLPFVIALAVAVVLAAGAGVFVRWLQNSNKTVSDNTKAEPLPESVNNAQDFLISGDTTAASKAVEDALNDPATSNDEKFQLYIEQGRIAINTNDYQAALDAYTKAFAVKEDFEVARKLGSTYQQLGDNQKALEFYQKALDLNSSDSPTYESDNNVLQQMITALQEAQ